MFTGIISAIGEVEDIARRGDWKFRIACPYPADDYGIGDSIACDGVCLTVTDRAARAANASTFTVAASAETLNHTTLRDWRAGRRINLERALQLGDPLGGHLVSGHVDGMATLERIEPVEDSQQFTLAAPKHLAYLIAAKGSVALDGVSLTVNRVENRRFTVNIIPHTMAATTLGMRRPGDALNLEVDMLARYVARLMQEKE